MNAFEVYNNYLRLKRHFTRWDFEYRENRRLILVKPDAFATKKIEQFFSEKIAQKIHPLNRIIYAIADDPRTWIRQIAQDDEPYFRHRKVIEALPYNFAKEVDLLTKSEEHPFISSVSQHPRAARLYFGGKVSIETLAIINEMTDYANNWCTKNRMLADVARMITKYVTFLPPYDRDEFTSILADAMIKRRKEYNLEKIN